MNYLDNPALAILAIGLVAEEAECVDSVTTAPVLIRLWDCTIPEAAFL